MPEGPVTIDHVGLSINRGYGHFALSAADIAPLYTHAVAAGARELVSPKPSPGPGVRFAFLADPEGNLVELVERR